jgi:phosphoribosylglycinamide formyltransferase-1
VKPRLGVLISGRGSNLQSIIDATRTGALSATVAVVISNRAEAVGLGRAREAGIEALYFSPREYADRDAYDRALADALRARDVSLVCLAGYMRLVGTPLLEAFPNRILNIHPSLLPAFRGLEAQKQALEHGVKISGATVHIVNADLDAGPIVVQAPVPVQPNDTVESLSARILVEEHRIYPIGIAQALGMPIQPPTSSPRSLEEAVVAAMPFPSDALLKIVVLRSGESDLTTNVRRAWPNATVRTFDETFDVASLVWWDAMRGADVVVAPFVMARLTDAKKQYLYKAAADRLSPRGGLVVVERVEHATPVLHHLIWLKHAGFADVDVRWMAAGFAVFAGFTPSRSAAALANAQDATTPTHH